jgi:two-component system, chemotaxis family, protein-glutamate methylesterase/glutaminase
VLNKSLKTGDRKLSATPEVYHAVGQAGSLLVLFHRLAKVGGATLVAPQPQLDEEGLRVWMQDLERAAHSNLQEFEAKLVAPAEHAGPVLSFLQKQKIPVISHVTQDPKALETYFYTDTGRLRVAKLEGQEKAPERRLEDLKKSAPRTKRVLIVDDSKSVRQLLTKVLGSDPRLEVVGSCERPSLVEKAIQELKPDVITLDIHMPEMDGITLLKQIYPKFKIPCVMITSVSREEGTYVLDAMESGAVDYIQKPSIDELQTVTPLMIEKVLMASEAKVSLRSKQESRPKASVVGGRSFDASKILVIGASTGGTNALTDLFLDFPKEIPPVLVVQHIPAHFSAAFAQRLNQICPFEVKEAEDQDRLEPNRVLIAPGGQQMRLAGSKGTWRVELTDDPPVNRFKPSVDYLFESVVKRAGKQALGVILTGMGSDGANGLLALKNVGCFTLGQDEASCVVYGMPRAAFERGAVVKVSSLQNMAFEIFKAF